MLPGDELAGQVAIVTGAGRNIGRAIARALAAGGASVVVHARSSGAEAAETVNQIEASGGQACVLLGDLTQPDDVDRLVQETMDRFGRVDVLVNNAAVRHETSLLEMSLEEWHSILSATLDTAFLCTKAALPLMLEAGGGSIINIGGQTGHAPVAERAHVITAKGGIAAFTKAVAVEFADRNVTVNCVVPGSIDTVRGVPGAPDRPPSRRIPPAGRLGTVWEIAAMVRMLAGPAGRYVTGQTIHVNGGGYMP
jgi:3-oxoacyl-[acyl-carrier protein] reductase